MLARRAAAAAAASRAAPASASNDGGIGAGCGGGGDSEPNRDPSACMLRYPNLLLVRIPAQSIPQTEPLQPLELNGGGVSSGM